MTAGARRGPRRGTLREGLTVLGVAVRREPRVFVLSTVGAVLFGALTVADAWVLGWSADQVILPAYDSGVATTDALVTVAALFVGVAVLRAVSIVALRWGAGIMQYRMQAAYRREVTRQYLVLPMAWHQRHGTGTLLSNANSDVEAAWAPIAPLPMAVGMPIVGLAAVGLRMPPFHASFGATALSYLWRIPLALFTLGLSGVLIWQWLTITAFLRFWRARRR